MKIGLFVHKIHQFEPNTGQNTQDRCERPLKMRTSLTKQFMDTDVKIIHQPSNQMLLVDG